MTITLREVSATDDAFLRRVYACTRAQEMSMVPWTDEQREAFLRFQFDAQNDYYRAQFPGASFIVIENHATPVGRLYISREPEVIRILDITVLPEHRAAGIGSTLIKQILAEADEQKKTVTVWVE